MADVPPDVASDFPHFDLSVLTPRQRLVVTLHYFDNWSLSEISAALAVKQRNVERLQKRAIERLRTAAIAGSQHL